MDATETGARLVISEMVLENFKSYAGAQHVGPFHKVPASEAMSLASLKTAWNTKYVDVLV